MLTQLQRRGYEGGWSTREKPVHSLLLVKSIPTMRLEDSRPAFAKASVTLKYEKLLQNVTRQYENFKLLLVQYQKSA